MSMVTNISRTWRIIEITGAGDHDNSSVGDIGSNVPCLLEIVTICTRSFPDILCDCHLPTRCRVLL